jgi:hypothetical protein
MDFDLRRVAEFIRGAETEELLDRVTVYRAGMEEVALDLMEGELDRRGITREQIAEHYAKRRACAIMLPDGTAMRCSFCDRPAVCQARAWHWVRTHFLISIPVFKFKFAYCAVHRKPEQPESGAEDANPQHSGES